MDLTITLPGGEILGGSDPVVVIGPNGSGKTRQSRNIGAQVPLDFINALRNTRVAPELPAVGMDTARQQFASQKNQSRSHHWELASEFDYMLSQLLAQQSMAAIEFTRRFQTDPNTAGVPEETPLTRVERLWGDVFPGRELHWRDWKPLIKNHATGTLVEYSGNQMSDGEKAALYLAGRVLSAEPGVLVVDEPETHFHALLAVKLWNALEAARPDIRFVYVTHDLTFALSRRGARLVLASPTEGLRTMDVAATLPSDVAEALLGSASLSFYASRVVFCEGDAASIDSEIYGAWFSGPDTVVRPVGNCQRVLRCVDAMANTGITSALSALGIIDGDYNSEAFRASLPKGLHSLDVHEAESLLCLPDIVEAVCAHVAQPFGVAAYGSALQASVSESQLHQIVIERWKRRIEPHLEGLVASVSGKRTPLDQLRTELPDIFAAGNWDFSPEEMLEEEHVRVRAAVPGGPVLDFLAIVPGKQLLPIAARQASLSERAYVHLICSALRGNAPELAGLLSAVEQALGPHLPPRFAPVRPVAATPLS